MLNGEKSGGLAVIFHRLGPYHFARLSAAGKRLPVTAIEMSGVDKTYAWDVVAGAENFRRISLFENADSQFQPPGEVLNRVCGALENCRPDAVAIPGWSDAGALAALKWCRAKAVPVIVMSDSTAWDHARKWWKEKIKSRLVKSCSTGFVAGESHRDYLEKLGMPRARIFQGYDAVDNGYFAQKADEARLRSQEIRNKHVLPEKFFLASARFVEKKNLPRLIRAYARYRELSAATEPWHLVLLGDGELKSAILELRRSLGLEKYIHLPGFKQYDELPAYYALSSAFIQASTTEQWGLVVNEAMASGLPVLVSNRCGCARDLVREGVNGFTFDPHDTKQMAELMSGVSDGKFPVSDFGKQSRRIIADWGLERFVDGLQKAMEFGMDHPPSRETALDRLVLKVLIHR